MGVWVRAVVPPIVGGRRRQEGIQPSQCLDPPGAAAYNIFIVRNGQTEEEHPRPDEESQAGPADNLLLSFLQPGRQRRV